MPEDSDILSFQNIDFRVIYSGRKSLGISVLPDSTVVVRVPYRTSLKTIKRIVQDKAAWIIKHRDSYTDLGKSKLNRLYSDGEKHLFRGNESVLKIERSYKKFIRFNGGVIELGLDKTDDPVAVKRLLYSGYKYEALTVFPMILSSVMKKHEDQRFKPSGLIIRSMKRRWGSCSNRGMITLSTELIKLSDMFIEYVILHELCHLKHHNHGTAYYSLLSELFPDWKDVRKELRKFIR